MGLVPFWQPSTLCFAASFVCIAENKPSLSLSYFCGKSRQIDNEILLAVIPRHRPTPAARMAVLAGRLDYVTVKAYWLTVRQPSLQDFAAYQPFDLQISARRRVAMDYRSTEFGVDISSRFSFRAPIDSQAQLNTLSHTGVVVMTLLTTALSYNHCRCFDLRFEVFIRVCGLLLSSIYTAHHRRCRHRF